MWFPVCCYYIVRVMQKLVARTAFAKWVDIALLRVIDIECKIATICENGLFRDNDAK